MHTRKILATAAALAAGGLIPLATPATADAAATHCSSGYFCAFDNAGYGGLLLKSRAARGSTHVDVGNDRTSSGSNNTGNRWAGVTQRTRLPDQTVFRFGPYSDVSYVGNSANDKIDHFNVVSP